MRSLVVGAANVARMDNHINENEFALPESLLAMLWLDLDYGRGALSSTTNLIRNEVLTYDAFLATYERVGEEDLDPDFIKTRSEHRIMLTEIHDWFATTLIELERLRVWLGEEQSIAPKRRET